MNNKKFSIGEWLADPSSNLLINKDIEKRVEPKVMELLVFLANAGGEVVSRESILDTVWEQIVLDDAITNTIANLRKALGDTSTPRQYIDTIPKQGYRLIPEVIWVTGEKPVTENEALSLRRESDQTSSKDKKVPNKLILITAAILIALIVGLFQFLPQQSLPIEQQDEQTKTVAVLPFYVYSEQAEVGYFADGLTEELIHQLATNHQLNVIARTSSSKFEGTDKGIKEISEILGAQYIIEGSIRQNKDILRITIQLIDADKQVNLWSKTFNKKLSDNFFDTQIKISREISQVITNKKSGSGQHSKRSHPNSAEAYKHFMIAQSHMKVADVEHFEKAFEYYQKATEIAPDYALAYTGMAVSKTLLFQYKHTSLEKTKLEVTALLRKALSIEPELAEAFAARGLLGIYLNDFQNAEADFIKALKLSPGLRIARHNYGFLLWRLSRSKEALVQYKLALEMDPLSPITNFSIGDTLTNLGEIEKAIQHYLHCQDVISDNAYCYRGLSAIYSLLGETKLQGKYLALSEKFEPANNFWQLISMASYESHRKQWDKSRQLLTIAQTQNNSDYFLLKVDFILNLHSRTLENYKETLKSLSLEKPNNFELNLLLGMTLYFESDCHPSIMQYEQAAKANSQTALSLWEFEHGVSHNLNLAYCYSQRNDFVAAQKQLDKFDNFINSFPKSKHIIPGKLYNIARFLVLTGKPEEAKKILAQINQWSLYWLSEKDPVLRDLKEYP